MELIRKFNYIFDTKRKIQSVFLCIGLFIGALLELAGVSLIAQLVGLIENPSGIRQTDCMI